MRCPKCGYNSFDHYLTCPKCRNDLAAVRRTLNLTAPTPGSVNFFRAAGQRLTFPEPILEADSLGASIAPPLAFGAGAVVIPAEEVIEDEPAVSEAAPAPENAEAFESPADLEPLPEDMESPRDAAPVDPPAPDPEPSSAEDSPYAEEPSSAEDSPSAEEPPSAEDSSPAEEPPPAEDISPVGDQPPEESPAARAEAAPDDETEAPQAVPDDGRFQVFPTPFGDKTEAPEAAPDDSGGAEPEPESEPSLEAAPD
jgi:hypothetical protein